MNLAILSGAFSIGCQRKSELALKVSKPLDGSNRALERTEGKGVKAMIAKSIRKRFSRRTGIPTRC
jgi:hypothetical protein